MSFKNHINLSKNSLARVAILIVLAVVVFLFLQTQFQYHFFHEEQDQLFLFSTDYIQSYFNKPAWAACLLGDFLTQFYYYTYAGPAILVICLLIMGDLICRCFKHCTKATIKEGLRDWVTFCIAIVLMLYGAYHSIDTTFKLSSIIAVTGACFIWWTINLFKLSFVSRLICDIILSIVCFWFFGYGVVFFIVFEFLSIFSQDKVFDIRRAVSILATIIVVSVIIEAGGRFAYLTFKDCLCYPNIGKSIDYNKEKQLEMCYHLDTEYYFNKYSNVTRAYEEYQGEKLDEMNFYYCLALEQLGQLPSKMTEMQKPVLGTFLKISDNTPMYQIKMINDLYYMLGDMTYTERAALLANTFSPNGRNVRMIKRLAEANLISGDNAAAMKYLRILSKTLVYRQWAKQHTPESMSPEVKAEIDQKHQFINKTDNIRLGDDCYTILTQLLDSNPKNTNALDYLLASDMLSHQRDVYIRDYEKYGPSTHPTFQEIYEGAKQ